MQLYYPACNADGVVTGTVDTGGVLTGGEVTGGVVTGGVMMFEEGV